MSVQVAGGFSQDGTVAGNTYNKYSTKNLISRYLVKGFQRSLFGLIAHAHPTSIHEVGCGEGYWVSTLYSRGYRITGSDFSEKAIELAKENFCRLNPTTSGELNEIFKIRSIYENEPDFEQLDLLLCCEVLEHLDKPYLALEALQKINAKYYIFSVPKEPIWRLLNLSRLKYILNLGNTPGHLNHWGEKGFIKLLARYFDIEIIERPLPWTMVLCTPKNA